MEKKRSDLIDLFRVLAIILMVIFHFTYDLSLFDYNKIDFYNEPFWFWLPRIIVSLFLTAVGASLVITYKTHFDRKKFFIRQSKLVFLSIGVSLLTYFIFPDRWIYFGTLHCITVTSFIGVLFIHRPNLSLILSFLILALILIFKWDTMSLSGLFPIRSMDFIPPYPWMAWVWLGIFLAYRPWIYSPFKLPFVDSKVKFLSRHSLIIYLIHQPILFSSIYLFSAARKM
ncbi:MAG: heparan-alpha-glucosaminide N-acetyltransferase [Bacteriovoracaceae bacterium]